MSDSASAEELLDLPPRNKDSTAGVSDMDVCCPWTRSMFDFDSSSNPGALTEEETTLLLRKNKTGVTICIVLQALLFVLWLLVDIVPGFVLYDGAVGSTSSYTHGGWWRIMEFIVILVGAVSVYFDINYSAEDGRIERNWSGTINWIYFYYVILFFGFVSHLVHSALTFIEISTCTSTLCVSYKWLIGVFVAMLLFSMLLDIWTAIQARKYQNNLKWAFLARKLDLSLSAAPSAPAADANDLNSRVERRIPTPSSVRAKAKTPLLQSVETRHGFKAKDK